MPNPVSAVDSVRNLMNIVKEVDFDDIHTRANQPPRILSIAPGEVEAQAGAERIFGSSIDRFVQFRSVGDLASVDPSRYDVILATALSDLDLRSRLQHLSGSQSHISPRIFHATDAVPTADEHLRRQIASGNPDLAPALGRWFLPFRGAAGKAIIDETAKANAQFAAISNLSATVPVLGGMVAAGADLIVLTKNQVMMAYKLAAVSDRDLNDHTGVIRELVPVVGAGFVWRSVAREATSFIPFAGGTIPKAVIAFVGTYSTGMAVDYFYRYGQKSSREQMQAFREQALALFSLVPLPWRGQDHPDDEAMLATGETVDAPLADARLTAGDKPGAA